MLDPKMSKVRQRRLIERMKDEKLDAVVVGAPHHVDYLSAFLTNWLHQSAFALFADGSSWMVTANQPAQGTAADEVASYEAQWNATLRQEQPAVVADLAAMQLTEQSASRIGVDASLVTSQLLLQMADGVDADSVEPILWEQRRVKDADELALMKTAIRCTERMYERARQIIEP